MSSSLIDVCRFNPTAGGTTDWTFSSAVVGYQSPTAAGAINGAQYSYRAESSDLSQWEVGTGNYNSGTGVFARTKVLFNSAGTTAKINFTVAPQVAIVLLAEDLATPAILRNYLSGLTISAAGSTTTFGVAAGVAVDSTNVDYLTLGSAFTKTTGAWAVGTGNGALDTGSISTTIGTTYHAFLIKRPDTGVVDVLISLSATAPTLPTNYTLFRRIGSPLRINDGSSNWRKFLQDGDTVNWDVPIQDVNVTNPGTAAVTRTISTPLGLRVEAILQVIGGGTVTADNPAGILVSDLSITDTAPTVADLSFVGYSSTANVQNIGGVLRCFTNTSSQVRSRVQLSTTGTALNINTMGWVDSRGKNA